MIRWGLFAFAALLVIGKLVTMSMQRNGAYAHADVIAPQPIRAQCSVCATYAASDLVDAYGTPTCGSCLRRIDANPREKRRFMFSMPDAAYW